MTSIRDRIPCRQPSRRRFDAIVEWIRSAGYALEEIENYAEWYRAFRNRLSSLERSKRRQSLLPLIHAWQQPMANSGARYDTTSLHGHLARLAKRHAAQPLAEMPSINEAFVHKCLADMCALGLIDPAR
jgi:fatty acid CoA ligase FadD9